MLICKNVSIKYKSNEAIFKDFDLKVDKGDIVLLTGNTGAGKTSFINAIMGMLPKSKAEVSGSIYLNNIKVEQNDNKTIKKLRKNFVCVMPQNAMAALNPTKKIGRQISVFAIKALKIKKKVCKELILEYMIKVGFQNPKKIYNSYPFELSAGMAQRCLFIISVITKPKLLILDEPTASVDTENAKELLNLVINYHENNECALIIITHDPILFKSVLSNAKIVEIGDKSACN